MKIVQKTTAIILVFLCAIATLLIAIPLITPWLIDHTSAGNKVRTELSQLVGGKFNFKQVDFSLFPAPCVVLTNLEINFPGQLIASAEAIELYPEILPLFTGRFFLKQAVIKRPEVTVTVPESHNVNKKSSSPLEISRVLPILSNTLARLSKIDLPVNHGTIIEGGFSLVYDNKTVLTLHEIEADLRNVSKNLQFQITAASDIFNKFSVTGSINTVQRKSSAHIELKNLQLDNAYNAFFPDAELTIHDGDADITMDFSMPSSKQVTLDFEFVAPDIRLDRAGQTADIKIQRFSGNLGINTDSATVTLSELLLDEPSMHISGSLMVSEKDPIFFLNLDGRDIDINSTRSEILALTRENIFVQTIFDILKGGKSPLVTISSKANVLNELGELGNLVVQADILQADVEIPGVNPMLDNVSGKIKLSQGILAGKKIQAQLKNSSIENGTLRLDLTKNPLPLHIETGINADAADIPTILALFIDDQDIKNELALIHDIQGSARGKLLLNGNSDQLKVNVSATDIQLAARYHKIPFPLTIAGGGVTYDEGQIHWSKLNGSLGTSSFAGLFGTLDIGKRKDFEITSGTSRILISEFMPWISSYEKMQGISKYFGGGKSILHLTKVTMDGPLKDFHRWHFNVDGELEDLVIHDLSGHPGPITIDSLAFNADPQKLEYKEGHLNMLDTSLTVSGTLQQYMAGIINDARLTLDGRIGPKTTQWLSQNTGIPTWLKFRPLSLKTSHLTYSNKGARRLTARLTFQNDLEVFADASLSAEDMVVKKLVIKDKSYQATLDGSYKDQSVDVSFDGILHESTLNKIFQTAPYLNGSLAGKAHTRLNVKNLHDVIFSGELNGKNLYVPMRIQAPLRIHKIVVKGEAETIEIKSADLTWSDTGLTLTGSIKPGAPEAVVVDLDMDVDSVDVEKIMDDLRVKNKSPDDKSGSTFLPLLIKGDIRLKIKQLKTTTLTIQPLHADINFQGNSADITLKETDLCSVPFSGTIAISHQSVAFNLRSEVKAQQLNATLNCFLDRHFKADGTFDMEGSLEGHGATGDLLKTSSGQVKISISNGHIYHDIIMLNVVKFLNISKVLVDRVTADKMLEKGLVFNRFETLVTLQNGKLECEKFILDSDEMMITGRGEMDLLQKQIKFTLLVAPQKTASTILRDIPLIGSVLQTVATIPLSVGGTIDDVHVLPLGPSAVDYQLKEIMRQTFNTPLKLVHLDDFHELMDSDKK